MANRLEIQVTSVTTANVERIRVTKCVKQRKTEKICRINSGGAIFTG